MLVPLQGAFPIESCSLTQAPPEGIANPSMCDEQPKRRRSPASFTLRLALAVALVWFGFFIILSSSSLTAKIVGAMIVGTMYAHLVEFMHELLHNLAYSQRWLNRAIGVVVGVPMLVSFTAYKVFHLLHHRDHGIEPTEFFDYSRKNLKGFSRFILSAFNLSRYGEVVKGMGATLFGRRLPRSYAQVLDKKGNVRFEVPLKDQKRIRFELGLMLVVVLAGGCYSLLAQSTMLLWLWVIPALWAEAVHFLIELPEHFGLNELDKDPYVNTRSITGSWFSQWLTNGNCFHIEHHVSPGSAIADLYPLHQATLKRREAGFPVAVYPSYWAFYRDVITGKIKEG